MGSVTNIIAGPLAVYIAPTSEALPELDDLTPPAVTVTPAGNWAQVGYTIDDFDFEYTADYEEVFINEGNGPVDHDIQKESGKFSYKEREKDAAALARAIAASTTAHTAAAANQTAQTAVGVGDGTPTKKSLLILGTNPSGGSRVIHVYKALVTGPAKFAHGKKNSAHTVQWEFEADMTQTAGYRLFTVYDITAAAAS